MNWGANFYPIIMKLCQVIDFDKRKKVTIGFVIPWYVFYRLVCSLLTYVNIWGYTKVTVERGDSDQWGDSDHRIYFYFLAQINNFFCAFWHLWPFLYTLNESFENFVLIGQMYGPKKGQKRVLLQNRHYWMVLNIFFNVFLSFRIFKCLNVSKNWNIFSKIFFHSEELF